MCIKCVLLTLLAERAAQFEAAAATAEVPEPTGEEALARGEEIHETLAAAGTAQASQPEYDEYTLLEMERTRSDIRNTDADTILKLAQAAKWLYDANHDASGVLRNLEQLVYPAPPKVEPQPVSKAEAEAVNTRELPPELAFMVEELRAAGLDASVVRIPL